MIDILALIEQELPAALLVLSPRRTYTAVKHLSGQHDQKKHGYRFTGTAPTLARARELRKAGLLQDYVGRVRQRAGQTGRPTGARTRPPGGGTAPKPKVGNIGQQADVTIKRAREQYYRTQQQLDDVLAEKKALYDRRTKISSERSALMRRNDTLQARRNVAQDDIEKFAAEADRAEYGSPAYKSAIKKMQTAERKVAKIDGERDRNYEKDDELYREDKAAEVRQGEVWNEEATFRKNLTADYDNYVKGTAQHREASLIHHRGEAAKFRASFADKERESEAAIVRAKTRQDQVKAEYDAVDAQVNWTDFNSNNSPELKQKWYDVQEKYLRATSDVGNAEQAHKYWLRNELRQGASNAGAEWDHGPANVGERQQDIWQAGVDDFGTFVGNHPALEKPINIGHMSRDPNGSGLGSNRSYERAGSVFLSDKADVPTVIHELGHVLETRDPAISAEIRKWYNGRTQGEALTWMGAPYGQHEKTRRDKFIHPYIGKEYGEMSGSSEVLSMGLQMFYENPMKMAREDSDYFDFIYAIVRMGL